MVYLVGAGPGDPGLLTLRGRELLEAAQVVVYDRLVNPRLLDYRPLNSELVFVGKCASSHKLKQEEINVLLIEHAQRGRRVVRLKGGDPFVFGRGGEECAALAAAGVRFEVVPGITAAVGVAAYAGIPVTHRDFNSTFTLVTGHEKDVGSQAPRPDPLDWATLAKLPCVAFYMGVGSLDSICAKLIEHGMSASTPAATIERGTTPRQRTIVGTLADLPRRVIEAGIEPPAMTIVGRVVEMRETVKWFESRPLFGQTIVVTRALAQARGLADRLESHGADVVELPAIETVLPQDTSAIDAALQSAGSYDWIVFTSAAGVRFARERVDALGLDVRVFGKAKFATIGAVTSDALRDQFSIRTDLMPVDATSEAIASELGRMRQVRGRRLLLLQAKLAGAALRDSLWRLGAAEAIEIAMYETRMPDSNRESLARLETRPPDWITFTSASTVDNLVRMLGRDAQKVLSKARLASIGPKTTAAIESHGLRPTVQAARYDIEGLVEAILNDRRD